MDVGRFFYFSLGLAVISFCSKTRRIDLVVGVVFVEGDAGLNLSNSRLAFRLCLLLGFLEDSDLHLELVIELFLRFLLMGDSLTIEGCLPPSRSDWACSFICFFLSASI